MTRDDLSDDDRDQLRALYASIEAEIGQALPAYPGHVTRDVARRALARGAMRLLHFEGTVRGGTGIVDHVGSRTIEAFEPDYTERDRARVMRAIAKACEISHGALEAAEARAMVDQRDALALRHALIAWLERSYDLRRDLSGAYRLFGDLYPDHPLRESEVSLLYTGAALFFAVPHDGVKLTVPDPEVFDEEEEGERREFVRRMGELKQRYMAHFPVFGFFRASMASPELLARLEADLAWSREEIEEALTTIVSILPRDKVDQYIVHDAWGHNWQALLFDFEAAYRKVSRYDELPAWDEERGGTTLAAIVGDAVERAPGWREGSRAYLRALFAERLATSLEGLVAEVLADVIEHKFVRDHPEITDAMPSSSHLKELPAKLDLALLDLPLYFYFANKAVERIAQEDERFEAFAAEAARRSGIELERARPGLEALREEFARFVDEEAEREITTSRAESPAIVKVALQFATICRSLNRCLSAMRAAGYAAPYADLAVFATAEFYQADPARNFWFIDEFVALHLLSLYEAFAEEM